MSLEEKKTTTRKPASFGQVSQQLYEIGKLPPQAVELEEAVLGALMLEKDALTAVIDILQPKSFYKEAHGRIFSAIQNLFQRSEPIDILTVTQELKRTGELEIVGGAYYISQLTNRVASSANVEFHARIISQKYIQRELIRISSDTIREAYDDTADVFDLLDNAERNLFSVVEGNIRKNYDKMSSLISQAMQQIEAAKNQKSGVSGVPSGFTDLDRMTSGWQPSDLVILAARPAMGKCLGKGTKVVMFDGTLKNVEDVQAGDLLMGDDSTSRLVMGTTRGQENMYWVHQNHGISYRVNESHILSLKRSRNEGGHKHGEVLNIEIRDYLQKSDKFKSNYKGYKVAVEFDEQPLSVDPYFLGLWLGDGHSYSSRITNTDAEVIDYIKDYAEELELEFVEYKQEGKATNYSITKGFRGQQDFFSVQGELRAMNLIENKHIPQQYISNSTANRLQLLAGLIDSDGHYSEEFNVYEITQKNERLAKEIKYLCDTLGFKTSLNVKKATIADRNFSTDVYRVRISGNVDIIPVKIERKKARERKAITDWRQTGITVEFDKFDDYYGFEIDGNHLFLLEDMTVTHNTAFVLTLARNAAVEFQKPIAVFSLEMASVQLVQRLISAEAELSAEKLKKGQLLDHEMQQLHVKIGKLSEAPLFIDDTPALSIFEMRAKCRRLKAQHDIQMVIVDYLQLMTAGGDNSRGNREQEISTISRSLKSIAKELNIPIIALSQLSRAVETRGGDKRPQLSDLRESGAIEQDADMVLFIHRPEYYGFTQDAEGNATNGLAEIIIAKHRNGAVGSVNLRFVDKLAKFMDMDGGLDGGGMGTYSNDGNGPYDPKAGLGPNDDFNNFPTGGGSIIRGSKLNDIEEDPF
ncbi:MAG: replicative DNA helicase [Bacteroidia bacterium]|nr:replicative DNA helicase [Bacteroidia bacterium]